ncbi:MAG: hypothetical protein L0Y72_19650 [Gemmataceae bacterium]|nr:hypothetical protein [Gemmataceae bacterium]MCI0741252.1 hypothetical protein [Gemmataceae bacterium]
MLLVRKGTLAASCLVIGLLVVAHGNGQGTVPGKDVTKLIANDAKVIQVLMAKPVLDKKAITKARSAAYMIAVYAQHGGNGKNPAMATLRDQALNVVKALTDGRIDDAKKAAKLLGPDIKADPAAKPDAVDFAKHLELKEVMKQFSSERFGGYGIELAIETLVETKGEGDFDKTANLAYKVAFIGTAAQAYPPEKDEGKKTKKSWLEFSKDMHAAAVALGDAANAKRGADIGKLANHLSETCIKCHDIFR